MVMPYMSRGSYETAVGTAVHSGIETLLANSKDNGDMIELLSPPAVIAMVESFNDVVKRDNIDVSEYDIAGSTVPMMTSMLAEWVRGIGQSIPLGGMIEKNFSVYTGMKASNGYDIVFSGTIDYVVDGMIWDWKTGKRKYSQREKQLQAVQPTIYTYAASQLGLIPSSDEYIFKYGLVTRSKNPECHVTSVRRTAEHHNWVLRQAKSAVETMLHVTEPMPADDHFLCSEKWCSWWSVCKGASVSPYSDYLVEEETSE